MLREKKEISGTSGYERFARPQASRRWALLFVCLLAVLVLVAVPSRALAVEDPTLSEGQSAAVMDADGNLIYGYNEYDEVPMASITKIMTAMVAIDMDVPEDTVVTIVSSDMPSDAQSAGFEAGSTVTFDELMQAMLVYSANDAAYNIACYVAGSEDNFVALMNAKANEIGLEHTHFANSHGLEEDGHYSCAADLVTMGRYALENYPEIAELVTQESCTISVNGSYVTFESTDELLGSYPGACGIKTGHTAYGYSFLGSCERDGLQIYTCVLGCDTSDGRFNDTRTLWDWAFGTYYPSRTFATTSMNIDLVPYADHYGYWIVVKADQDLTGFIDTDGEDLTWSRTSIESGLAVLPGQPYAVITWKQGDRVVAKGSFSTSTQVIHAPYFGRLTTWLFVDPSAVAAA